MSQHKISVYGSGWISARGFGCFGSEPVFTETAETFVYPQLQDYIAVLPPRFGRFDVYSRVTFSAAVLALHDAGIINPLDKQNIGVIASSLTGVYDNDLSFFDTTNDSGGSFASPNLFSYTLPNVALGEVAVHYHFTGPSFCLGNNPVKPGRDALESSIALLSAGLCDKALVGWVEVSQNLQTQIPVLKGAAFSLISISNDGSAKKETLFDQNLNMNSLF